MSKIAIKLKCEGGLIDGRSVPIIGRLRNELRLPREGFIFTMCNLRKSRRCWCRTSDIWPWRKRPFSGCLLLKRGSDSYVSAMSNDKNLTLCRSKVKVANRGTGSLQKQWMELFGVKVRHYGKSGGRIN
ncbi:hypothetical protein D3C73_1174230 [compost metagenome]